MKNTTSNIAAVGVITLLFIADFIYFTVAQTTTEIPRWVIIAISVLVIIGLVVFFVRNRLWKGGTET